MESAPTSENSGLLDKGLELCLIHLPVLTAQEANEEGGREDKGKEGRMGPEREGGREEGRREGREDRTEGGRENWENSACVSQSPGPIHSISLISHSAPGLGDTIIVCHFASGEQHLKEVVSWLRSQLTGQEPGDPGTSDSNSRASGPVPQHPASVALCS